VGGNLTARFEKHGGNTGLALAVGCVGDVALHLVSLALKGLVGLRVGVVKGRQLVLLALGGSEVDEVLDSLLVLSLDLHSNHRRVDHLSVDALELSVVAEVDFDVLMLGKKLTDQLEDAEEGLMEGALLHLGLLGHGSEVGLNHGFKLDLGLIFIFNHLGVVVEAEHVEVVVVELDVGDPLVVHEVLEADGTEVGEVDGALHLNLGVAPTKKFKCSVTVNDK
jgi:hypothetical protein